MPDEFNFTLSIDQRKSKESEFVSQSGSPWTFFLKTRSTLDE